MDRRLLFVPPLIFGIILISAGIIITMNLSDPDNTTAPRDTGAVSACKYNSTQVRVKMVGETNWEDSLKIECGEQFEVSSFHDQTGEYATDTKLTITGPGVNRSIINGDKVTTSDPGTYTLKVTTTGGTGPNCEGTASVTCNAQLPKYECEDINLSWSYPGFSPGTTEVNWSGEIGKNGTPSCELKTPMASGSTNPGSWVVRVYENAITPDLEKYISTAVYNRGPFSPPLKVPPSGTDYLTVACVEVDMQLVPGITDDERPESKQVCNPVKVRPPLPGTGTSTGSGNPVTPNLPELPKTGVSKGSLLLAAGLTLAATGLILYWRYRKLAS